LERRKQLKGRNQLSQFLSFLFEMIMRGSHPWSLLRVTFLPNRNNVAPLLPFLLPDPAVFPRWSKAQSPAASRFPCGQARKLQDPTLTLLLNLAGSSYHVGLPRTI
jgi:hypothetical protein